MSRSMGRSASSAPASPLSGRKAQAARNDEVILEAARAVFLTDPKAPVSAVAERAGVGISALYRRYPGKEDLLRTLCHDGLRRYNIEAETALANPNDWQCLVELLRRIVDADVHSLTVHLAGTFTPTLDMFGDVQRSGELNDAILARARTSGRLRAEVTTADFGLVYDACAAVVTPDPVRTSQLRHRVLGLLIDGLATPGELPGPPPTGDDFAFRWSPVRR